MISTAPKWVSAQKEFESWFVDRKSAHCFEFHDARLARASGGSRRIFTAAHPSDFIVTDRGKTFYAEVKSCSDPVLFSFSLVRPSQWNAAIRVTRAGGEYFFFIKNETTGVWYKIPGAEFILLRENEKKSAKWAYLSDYIYQHNKE